MIRKVPFAEGEYYHLYSRGVEKRNIFLDDRDRVRFIRLLYLANGAKSFVYRDIESKPISEIERGEPLSAVGAYVLMPNHFHVLIKEIKDGGTTEFMRKLLTGYSSYFNRRHNRVGSLFQSRFKAEHIFRDEHLKYLFAYIHLNPVKMVESKWKEEGLKDINKAKNYLKNFPYSSFRDYIGPSYGLEERAEKIILSPKDFPDYFSEKTSFEAFLEDWLTHKQAP